MRAVVALPWWYPWHPHPPATCMPESTGYKCLHWSDDNPECQRTHQYVYETYQNTLMGTMTATGGRKTHAYHMVVDYIFDNSHVPR